MNLLTKTVLIAGLSLASVAGNFSVASADDRGYRNGRHHNNNWNNNWNNNGNNGWRGHDNRRDRRSNRNNAVAAGVLGLAAGAIIAGALAQPQPIYREPIYNAPPPAYYPPTPARGNYNQTYNQNYQGGYQPWSREWYNYCSQRYRSFNAQSGTFRGYDGRDHFCVAN